MLCDRESMFFFCQSGLSSRITSAQDPSRTKTVGHQMMPTVICILGNVFLYLFSGIVTTGRDLSRSTGFLVSTTMLRAYSSPKRYRN